MSGKPQNYEHMAVSYLRSIGISIAGYYQYDHATDVVGFLKLPSPFKYPLKVAAEIAKSPVTADTLDGFSKFARNTAAEKVLLLTPQEFDELDADAEKKLQIERIEFIKSESVNIFSKTKTQSQAKQEYEKIRDVVSPTKLIKELPTFAKQFVPQDLQKMMGDQKLDAWQLLEEAVYCVFYYGFGYAVRQLGKEALFKNEPEGVVTTGGTKQFALLYDCKSSSTKYTMTADDERTYVGYITKKKKEVASLDHCELKYFLVISPDFGGDVELRGFDILKETQVLLVLVKAETLKRLGLWVASLPLGYKQLIELPDILGKEAVLSDSTVDNYIKTFNETYQKRY